jgi:hypothetical protein
MSVESKLPFLEWEMGEKLRWNSDFFGGDDTGRDLHFNARVFKRINRARLSATRQNAAFFAQKTRKKRPFF